TTRGIPVVFLSVMEDPARKHLGFEVGGVDYVTKPFHADEVRARVRAHVTNKRLREELESHNALMGLALHEKSRQLEALMNNLPGLAYRGEHDPHRADRQVSFVSQGALRLTGFPPDSFIAPDTAGANGTAAPSGGLLAIVHPDDRARILESLRTALQQQEPFELTYRIITAWGEEKWVWEQGMGVHGTGVDGQETLLVEGFINDVTEKQKQDTTIREENRELRERLKARCSGDIVGNSPQISTVFELIAKAAAVDDNVVVYGESGTGKELVARAIHDGSARYQHPFVAVNCGAIPENLFESELFGYKKGAFTGANMDKKGYLDLADGGTLFLDELGEISLMGQVKLLRAIEHGGFTPVGGSRTHTPNVRIVAATNRDLLERVHAGAMRHDFYYRIHVIPIHLPPLRERKADIPLLVEHFLKAYPSNKRFRHMDSEMLHAFMLYDWPGNVRELQNVLYQYLSLGSAHVGPTRIGIPTGQTSDPAPDSDLPLPEAVARYEKAYLLNALRKNNWRRGPTAECLGVDRRTLFRKMKDFNLEKEDESQV
ncbi:MAG: sigma 54-interacting transcriptional regulator, partial [Bilophila sp.]